MGIFKNQREVAARIEVEKAVGSIPDPDGKTHVMLVRSFGQTGAGKIFGADSKYNEQINEVLIAIQDKGMQIVFVQTHTVPEKGYAGADRYDTLITYR